VARGRPRGSTAFASNPTAPRLINPLSLHGDQEVKEVIPATQYPPAQPTPQSSTPTAVTIMVSVGQPRALRAWGNRGGRTASGARTGSVGASIQRTPSHWEGVNLNGSQMTAVGGGRAVPTSSSTSSTAPRARGGGAKKAGNSAKPKGRPRKASGTQKASATAGITKNTRATHASNKGAGGA
jgi:hypothetical protein